MDNVGVVFSFARGGRMVDIFMRMGKCNLKEVNKKWASSHPFLDLFVPRYREKEI